MTNAALDTKDGRRPLHYKNFENRVRNYCQRDIKGEFTEVELRAIVYDYLNVVYRGIWKADERYALHENKLNEFDERHVVDLMLINNLETKNNILKFAYERTICFKTKLFFNKLKSCLTWSKDNGG